MHKSLDLTQLGGLYAYQDTLKFMQDGYGGALDAIGAGYGNKVVISGCVDSGASVADGWVCIDGVIMPFVGGVKPGSPKVKVNTVITKELYDDGILKDFYTVKYASLVSVGDFDYSELKRLTGDKGVYQSILDLQTIVSKIVNVEDGVVISGCVVSAIDVGASTCNISAGTAMLGGVLREMPAVVGVTFPIYITSDGTWNNALPAAPFIKFDPHTSQRYADVLRRATTPVGEIKMFKTLSDRFVAGIGKWEMLGFRLMEELQSRVPLGLRFDGVAEANVSDANYDTAGNQGGEKEHTLTEAEMPAHSHGFEVDKQYRGDVGNPTHSMASQATGLGTVSGSTDNGAGGDDPHNNVQPYTVVVYAERI